MNMGVSRCIEFYNPSKMADKRVTKHFNNQPKTMKSDMLFVEKRTAIIRTISLYF